MYDIERMTITRNQDGKTYRVEFTLSTPCKAFAGGILHSQCEFPETEINLKKVFKVKRLGKMLESCAEHFERTLIDR